MLLQDKYINPLTDFGFKKLFGTEVNKILLIDFLNQVLPEKHQIQDLSYANNEQLGVAEVDRKAIFDLFCTGNNGEKFIVEIQKAKQNFFKDRSVFYASFPIQEQGKKGIWNFQLAPVYTIGILDFVFDDHKEEEQLLHEVTLKNQRCEVFYDKLKFIYIELPKFKKKEHELNSQFDKWLYVFCYLAELQDRPAALQEKIFTRLFEAAEIAKFSKDEREAYENSLKYYRDLNNVIDTSREEGREEGIEQGRQEGIEKGREEGKKEAALNIARNLKNSGLSNTEIAAITGLSVKEIDTL
ncbi:MAG: Rpn family recombination-promoting nuclease/putative transposase [Bacteroidota bacterium]